MSGAVCATAVPGIPALRAGDDLADIVAQRSTLADGDVVVVAHKAISKCEGRTVALATVTPGDRARTIAAAFGKDPRQVQVVLDESQEILRDERGVIISRTHHGFVCANAGVDASNAGDPDTLVLLPLDPDASARALRASLRALTGRNVAVVVTDSFGRAWRHGQCDVAIGVAGLGALDDQRGERDADGRTMHATWIAVADEIAAAADLARSKAGGQPVVVVSGLGDRVGVDDGPGATPLLRTPEQDLFR